MSPIRATPAGLCIGMMDAKGKGQNGIKQLLMDTLPREDVS